MSLESETGILSIFQTYSWAEVLQSLGTNAHFFVAVDQGRPVAGLLVFQSSFAFGALRAYEARGGFLSPIKMDDEAISAILATLQRRVKRERTLYTFVYPNPLMDLNQYFLNLGYVPYPCATFMIDLGASVEELWAKLHKKARWGVRKSQKAGLTVTETKNWSEWHKYYRIYANECRQLRTRSRSIALHKKIHEHLMPKQMAKLFTAKLGDKIVAGSLFLATHDEMVYYENASNPNYLPLQPNNAIQWKAIVWAKEQSLKHYDLGGALWDSSGSSFLDGVHRFKGRWGGKLHKYNFYNIGGLYAFGKHIAFQSSKLIQLYYLLERRGLIKRFDRL